MMKRALIALSIIVIFAIALSACAVSEIPLVEGEPETPSVEVPSDEAPAAGLYETEEPTSPNCETDNNEEIYDEEELDITPTPTPTNSQIQIPGNTPARTPRNTPIQTPRATPRNTPRSTPRNTPMRRVSYVGGYFFSSENSRPDWREETTQIVIDILRNTTPRYYPSYYGGSFYNNNGNLVVLIAASSRAEAESTSLWRIIDFGARIRLVEHSWYDIMAIHNYLLNIDGWNENPILRNVNLTYTDVVNNRFIVELYDNSAAQIARFRREVIDSPMLVFREASSFFILD